MGQVRDPSRDPPTEHPAPPGGDDNVPPTTGTAAPDPASSPNSSTHRMTVVFPAVMSVVAALLGALAGGAVTLVATDQQVDRQLAEERAAQLRETRSRTYGAFFDAVTSAHDVTQRFYGCLPRRQRDSAGLAAYGVDWTPVGHIPAGSADLSTYRFDVVVPDGPLRSECTKMASTLGEARLTSVKAYNQLFSYASPESREVGAELLRLIPVVTCLPSECVVRMDLPAPSQNDDSPVETVVYMDDPLVHLADFHPRAEGRFRITMCEDVFGDEIIGRC